MGLSAPTTFSFTTSQVNSQWYRLRVFAGIEYHVQLDSFDVTFIAATLWAGDSCSSLGFVTVLANGAECYTFTAPADGSYWLEVVSTDDPANYTFTFDEGPC